MRIIYLSEDNLNFDTKEACIKHEQCLEKLRMLMSKLKPNVFNFETDTVQQEKEVVTFIIKEILTLFPIFKEFRHYKELIKDPFKYRRSIVVRFISEHIPSLIKYWKRFENMDNDYIEYTHITFVPKE